MMENERENNSIALPRELWDEAASRAEANGCGVNDIIERAVRAYFDLTGEPVPGEAVSS